MALRRQGSDHKVSQPADILSKAAFRSVTRRSSAAKSRQVPITAKSITKNSSEEMGKEGVERKLTSQHLAGRLDNAKNKRFALFIMNNLRRQAGDLFLKRRYLFHITTGFASFVNSHLCLTLG
jgi:hypothetical protein